MIHRQHITDIKKDFFKGKAITLLGARQTGKSTLIDELLNHTKHKSLLFNADVADVREMFQNPNASSLRTLIGDAKVIVIDEAQRIKDAGLLIKIFTDQIKEVQIIVTGSSALDLASTINEPLTGRQYEYRIFPLSFAEMVKHHGYLEESRQLKHRMVFGYYPEIITRPNDEIRILKSIAGGYLYKDLLTLDSIKKTPALDKLTRALALQVGNEVSYNELSRLIGIDKETVEKYINLLEQAFIVFKLDALNRNVRNEIKKGKKVYFWDNGIMNAIIGNFVTLEQRSDVGALWENFIISERMKYNSSRGFYGKSYFWRTQQQQEIDYLEEVDGSIDIFEFKWHMHKNPKFPLTFLRNYDVRNSNVISPKNYPNFVQ
jgi:predicted AAA+ superfamily ATPase